MTEIGGNIELKEIKRLLLSEDKIQLSVQAKADIVHCHDYLQKKITESEQAIYGINTGFGSLYDTSINSKDLKTLQNNLLRSHTCGTGDEVPHEIVRIMLLLKILSLCKGHSGVQLATVERLVEMYNNKWLPQVFDQGSLGASGDLAPLAHLALPLIGEGKLYVDGVLTNSSDLFSDPIDLRAKEGLALINGTQFMSAYGVYCLIHAYRLSRVADVVGALSLEAFNCRSDAFAPQSHRIRPHNGQQLVAKRILKLLEGSEMQKRHKEHVQDPYSFRCIPQVHGASFDVFEHAYNVFMTEVNSVTDNPNIFPDEDLILSAGNFHGQPLALQLDFLAIALAELASISERRTYKLISGKRGLPAFLIEDAGLNSGFMIPQYTAASIVSQNKQLCTPASVDSIVSSNGQEDHVSMGANAATKCLRVLKNTERVLAIEILNAVQAMDIVREAKSSDILEEVRSSYREVVPFVEKDQILADLIHLSAQFIADFDPIENL